MEEKININEVRNGEISSRKFRVHDSPPDPPILEPEPPTTAFFPKLVVVFPPPTFPKANLVCPPLPAPPGTSAIFGFFVGGSTALSSTFFTCAVDADGIVGEGTDASVGLELSLLSSSRETSAFGLGFCGETTWIEEEDESRVAGAGRLSGFDMVLAETCDNRDRRRVWQVV
jgi:hypothetical protein